MTEAVCLASGPSLTQEDVETVRQWRGPGRIVVVANTTFRAAPWADALFAMDSKWWRFYGDEVNKVFKGQRFTTSSLALTYGAKRLKGQITAWRNSGACAIAVAEMLGAERIALLGYDCQHDEGRTHWHGSHPEGLGDARTVNLWPRKFEALAKALKVPVVNCSRRTALTCFQRGELMEFIGADCYA